MFQELLRVNGVKMEKDGCTSIAGVDLPCVVCRGEDNLRRDKG